MRNKEWLLVISSLSLFAAVALAASATGKPPITLEAFFNAVSFPAVAISPDGLSVVIKTERADWAANRFRHDLWLYRDGGEAGSLVRLTQAGRDKKPRWSPDGHWIAFLSTRPAPEGEKGKPSALQGKSQIYVISPNGGEPFRLTSGGESVHAFAWSADSRRIYFATREPWSKKKQRAYREEWNDVIQFRESERGDSIYEVDVRSLLRMSSEEEEPSALSAGPREVAATPFRVEQLSSSPDGKWLAFSTESRSKREESLAPYGIYVVPLATNETSRRKPVPLLENPQAFFDRIAWSRDGRHLFFSFLNGSVEGPYRDAQSRVYWVSVNGASGERCGPPEAGRQCVRWGSRFFGSIDDFTASSDGGLIAAGRMGTEVQPYLERGPGAGFAKLAGWPGTYGRLSASTRSQRIAFVYSSLERPAEVYLASSIDKIAQARSITSFNQRLSDCALPRGKPYRWVADDGVKVEGMLIYPPGKFDERHLPMLTLIHGGPEDADGNHFEADWYQWAALAATDGWLVFEPNYRGSIGYGDSFALGIIPHIVSHPGKDILEGVDALVNAGIADSNHLTIGGYSYGGYMTNWLITQTTRFKAAMTGAGAVEHVANWGNDDTTFDDAYFLGGVPWEAEKNYNSEAAIWQIGKVRTPTHIVAGSEDIRVYVGEDYLLERALHTMGVPTSLLIFPGEGHSLDKNPWHGKIKVREELKWLDRYGR